MRHGAHNSSSRAHAARSTHLVAWCAGPSQRSVGATCLALQPRERALPSPHRHGAPLGCWCARGVAAWPNSPAAHASSPPDASKQMSDRAVASVAPSLDRPTAPAARLVSSARLPAPTAGVRPVGARWPPGGSSGLRPTGARPSTVNGRLADGGLAHGGSARPTEAQLRVRLSCLPCCSCSSTPCLMSACSARSTPRSS